jgi:hypothetical protein
MLILNYEKKVNTAIVNNFTNINKTNNYTSHRNSLNIKIYHLGNAGPGLPQVRKCGRVKPVNGMPNLPLLITGSPNLPLLITGSQTSLS